MGTKQGKERNPGVQLGKQNRGKSKSGYDDQRGAPQFYLYCSHKGVQGSGEPCDLSAYIYG